MTLYRRLAIGLAFLGAATASALADAYDNLPAYNYPSEAAQRLSPYDPVPEIGGNWCRYACPPKRVRHQEPERSQRLPGLLGHETFLVDCGKARHETRGEGRREDYRQEGEREYDGRDGRRERDDYRDERRHGPNRRGVFTSIDAAAAVAPPNATILIIPPGEGMTCVETVHARGPLTIATYGAGQAVIQAPPGQPCLVARIPLGDQLIFDGVKFIARSRQTPCVAVEAGHVTMRNSVVDARGTEWAFDVHESGTLTLEQSRIETDFSGVHARRATVELKNVDIDIAARNDAAVLNLGRTDCVDRIAGTVQGSVGLALECSEGRVESTAIYGAAVGVIASAGTRALRLTDLKLMKPDTGILVLPGQVGQVIVERANITKARDGIILAPGADAQVTASVISDSRQAGITSYGSGALISTNKIVGAEDGIRILASQAFPPPQFPAFAGEPRFDGDEGGPIVENNMIANSRRAGVRIDARFGGRQHRLNGKLIGNTIYADRPSTCIDDGYNDDPVYVKANTCNRDRSGWPF